MTTNNTMSQEALEVLRTIYGYENFRNQQHDIVSTVIAGNDALVLMPTGGGKSLCYQIPSLVRAGVGIVVSPLIALMQDQVDALKAMNLSAAFINSSMDTAAVAQTESALLAGELDMLYVLLMKRTVCRSGGMTFAKNISACPYLPSDMHTYHALP